MAGFLGAAGSSCGSRSARIQGPTCVGTSFFSFTGLEIFGLAARPCPGKSLDEILLCWHRQRSTRAETSWICGIGRVAVDRMVVIWGVHELIGALPRAWRGRIFSGASICFECIVPADAVHVTGVLAVPRPTNAVLVERVMERRTQNLQVVEPNIEFFFFCLLGSIQRKQSVGDYGPDMPGSASGAQFSPIRAHRWRSQSCDRRRRRLEEAIISCKGSLRIRPVMRGSGGRGEDKDDETG